MYFVFHCMLIVPFKYYTLGLYKMEGEGKSLFQS